MREIPVELRQRYREHGWWTDDTLGELLSRGLEQHSRSAFRVHSDTRPWQGTFGEVEHTARRLAAGLHRRGIGPGDVVVFQLPNWMEAAATFWAAAFLGAVVVPVVHFYGDKELSHILRASKAKAFITAEQFGRMRFNPDICGDVPVVGVVGRDFDDLLAETPLSGTLDADPGAAALIAFTSGTTSDPKGVIHSHQTLGFETRQLAAMFPEDRGDQLTATPVGHFIGMLSAFLIPVLDGTPVNLADTWDPALALRLMSTDGLVVGGGPPIFATSLVDHPHFTQHHLGQLKYMGLGGASVPHDQPPTHGSGYHRLPLLWQHRTSLDHRFAPQRPRGKADPHRRKSAERSRNPDRCRRRNPQPGTRSVSGLHRRGPDQEGVRRRRLVPNR